MFLHGSWSHVIGNMWYLWIFGDNVEDRVGHGRFIVFYLLCGIAAALGQIAIDPTSTLPTIGASGAIAGVMGAYFVLYPQSRVLTLIPLIIFWEIVELPAIVLLGFWFLMQLFSAGAIAVTASTHGSGGVAFMAHVAGFVVGLVGVFVFRKPRRDHWDRREATARTTPSSRLRLICCDDARELDEQPSRARRRTAPSGIDSLRAFSCLELLLESARRRSNASSARRRSAARSRRSGSR